MARRRSCQSVLPAAEIENLLSRARQLRYNAAQDAYTLAEEALRCAQVIAAPSLILDSIRELAICSHVLADYPQAIAWAELLLKEAICYNLPERQANAHTLQGISYQEIGYLDKALVHLETGLAMHKQGGRMQHVASAFFNIGNIYAFKGQFETALGWYQHALSLQEFASRELLARLLNSIGYAYYHLGNHTEALQYLTKCLAITEADDFKFMQITVMENLTELYVNYGDYATALNFCIQALMLSEQLQSHREIANNKLDLGTIYLQMGDAAAAIIQFIDALATARHLGMVWVEITALLKLGEAFAALGELQKATAQFSQAQRLAKELGYMFLDARAQLLWAKVLLAEKKTQDARLLLTQGLALTQQIGAKVLEQQYYETLSVFYQSLGDFSSSIRYAKYAESLYTQLNANRATRHLLMELETQRFLKMQTSPKPPDVDIALQVARKAIEQKYLQLPFKPSSSATFTANKGTVKLPTIFVKTFGEFSVTIDGRTLTKADWQRKKARDIFKILLIHHQKAVTIDELIEWLWGSDAEKDPQQIIKNSISFIRKALEPHLSPREPSQFLRTETKAYILDLGENAFIDFLAFKSLLQAAASQPDPTALYKQAISLYTGDFLKEDLYEEWSAFERELLKDTYLNALTYLAESALQRHQDDEATLYARQILATDHTYDKAYAILLKLLTKQGNIAEAHKVYKQCKEAFEKELGISPPLYLQSLLSAH
ncbi:MAG: tetratricopeptide repeat protein [Chloroherpetonaceae bacterium]|nr:tetratricopeptide repeat protein [Chloroherpetonaceae bacterium]